MPLPHNFFPIEYPQVDPDFLKDLILATGEYIDLAKIQTNDVERRNMLDFAERYSRIYRNLK